MRAAWTASDWRDSDRSQLCEETGAVMVLEGKQDFEYPDRISSEKIVCLLDTGQLIGVTFYS